MSGEKDEARAMLESLHAQMGEWIAELRHRTDLDDGEAWLMLDMNEWRGYVAESVAERIADEGGLNYGCELCPLSGIGKPPSEWGRCVVQCSWYDATKGLCAVQALWHLRELPIIGQDVGAMAAECAQ